MNAPHPAKQLADVLIEEMTELDKLKFIAQEIREADEDLREDMESWEPDAARDSRLIDRANARAINRG